MLSVGWFVCASPCCVVWPFVCVCKLNVVAMALAWHCLSVGCEDNWPLSARLMAVLLLSHPVICNMQCPHLFVCMFLRKHVRCTCKSPSGIHRESGLCTLLNPAKARVATMSLGFVRVRDTMNSTVASPHAMHVKDNCADASYHMCYAVSPRPDTAPCNPPASQAPGGQQGTGFVQAPPVPNVVL